MNPEDFSDSKLLHELEEIHYYSSSSFDYSMNHDKIITLRAEIERRFENLREIEKRFLDIGSIIHKVEAKMVVD